MKRLLAALSIAILSALPSTATAADTITYSGYLLAPGGGAETLTQTVVFSLYESPTVGTPTTAPWTTTKAITPSANGYFTATLGDVPSFGPPANIDFSVQHYLGIKVGSEPEMVPRIVIGAAPRALSVDWSAINAIPVQCSGATPVLQGFTATGAPVCVAQTVDTNTTYTAGAGLLLSGTVFSINATGCSAGQVLSYTGSGWACAADGSNPGTVTAVSAFPGGGIQVATGSTTPVVGLFNCPVNQLLKSTGANTYSCQADVDTDTTYTAGTGLLLSGTIFSANLVAAGGDAGTASSIARSDHLHSSYVTSASLTTTLGSYVTSSTLTTTLGSYVTSTSLGTTLGDYVTATSLGTTLGNYVTATTLGNAGTINAGANPVDWTKLKNVPAGIADGDDANTTYTAGVGLLLSGTVFSLPTSCGPAQVLKWNGAAWLCDNDNGGTAFTAGTGLTLSGSVFSLNNTGCNAGYVLAWDGVGAWSCQLGGTVTGLTADAKGGMAVSTLPPAASPETPSVGLIQTCSAGEVLKWSVANGWICATDIDSNTTYTNGTGLGLAGTTFSVNFLATGGDNGFVATAARSDHAHSALYPLAASLNSAGTINAAGNPVQWTRLIGVPAAIADGADADTTYTAGLGLLLTGTVFTPNFTAAGGDNGGGSTVARGDHVHDAIYYRQTFLNTAGVINTATNPVDWTKLKGVPAAIADGADADTTYTAGNGLTLTGTTFAINTTQTQARVTGSCSGGITSINAVGGVTCSPTQIYGFVTGSATAPAYSATGVIAFIASPPVVAVDGTQHLQVVSTAALGASGLGQATNLNLWICYRVFGSAVPPTAVGGGTFGLSAPMSNRLLYTLSVNVYSLPANTYELGLCGYTGTTPSYWTNNEYTYTTITTVN